MRMQRKIELIAKSSRRLTAMANKRRNRQWWAFMRREAWINLKRSRELYSMVLRRKR